MSALEVNGVSKRFGSLQVLQDINLRLERGQMLALIGRSGSGKSTLLRCMNGLERVDRGNITIGGHVLSHAPSALRRLRQDVGIVFQAYNLFPHLSVGRNIMLAPRLVLRWSSERAEARAREVLAAVGLSEKFDAYPDQLSGGQQQRVAIARSLAMAPQVMLFDEVTSALDPELTGEVLLTMEGLARSGMTMVLVTHEMNFARSVAHWVAFMHNGRIHEIGAAEDLFARPRTEELRRFLSSTL
ncbi:MAG: amino acid ABC transporter ATP-binding protein [Chelatococcus sp.]|jgi:polar amino acid transport system ATP-binding protein|uniref:amino acid ABC transporter ATP-binding protein n=1 Tax=unclassified Chelatococcus TaxID=2638111 RepID=UPI001BCE57D8|nr:MULTISPECIES: amino acid ABC transporter ATP-binding protein [unclassified Chelatococcus]CAH1649026.1 cystine ABC transporter ATP binding subunit [Hyphomicrobiales bacterium]MBS7741823.1 amino acid ABC transporter ATP-binding protein [Chelatococcus sp. HY11]MBX3538001.1 amino acid ABC transporter ATP-binding protein [Chelatococcus sp.]MBX3541379.1 amino acid ABC transporter ATP-binding protein [Chelatococcus sp.]MCO5074727.1 amino acid ABC transporter ATP-binding protein [Chelatococcus sp.]